MQAHRADNEIRVFTRSLDDITSRVPEVVEAISATCLCGRSSWTGRFSRYALTGGPRPFQVSAGQIGSRLDVDRLRSELPLTTFFFDLLHLDGEDWIERPGAEWHAALEAVAPAPLLILRVVTADPAEAKRFLAGTLTCDRLTWSPPYAAPGPPTIHQQLINSATTVPTNGAHWFAAGGTGPPPEQGRWLRMVRSRPVHCPNTSGSRPCWADRTASPVLSNSRREGSSGASRAAGFESVASFTGARRQVGDV